MTATSPVKSRICLRSVIVALPLLLALPFIFWLRKDAPQVWQDDPEAYLSCLKVYGGVLALFLGLTFLPNRCMGLRLFACSLAYVMGLLLIVDRLPPVVAAGGRGIIFQPHTSAAYKSDEFTFTATSNNYGFRDRDFDAEKKVAHRILIIGDSYPYGWGVDAAQTWPKVLEDRLREQKMSVEVGNLGEPGAGPAQYADTAEKAIPMLRPDLVVVAIYLGNDLIESNKNHDQTPFRRFVSRPLIFLYPNLSSALYLWRHTHEVQDVHTAWKTQAAHFVSSLTPDMKQRFDHMEPRLRDDFVNGFLNPSMVLEALNGPDRYRAFSPDDPDVRDQIAFMQRELLRIKAVADRYGTKVIVASEPSGFYVNRQSFNGQKRVGFNLPPELLTFTGADEAVARACQGAGLPFYAFTQPFRDKVDEKGLFFELDNHMAAGGHRLYGTLIAPVIETVVKGMDGR